MECNNTYCLWNYHGQCVHEDGNEAFEQATPNRLDCPVSLRVDFQEQLYNLVDECKDLLNRRSMKELMEIKKFIEKQRV